MATLQELIPYLERGYTLQSVRGETIRPLNGNQVEWLKAKGYRFEPEKYSMVQLAGMHDAWSWGVVFLVDGKHPFLLTDLVEIEEAIKNNVPGASYGGQPE